MFFAAVAAASAPVLSAVPSSIVVSEGESKVLYVRELEDEALRGVAPSSDMYEVLAARQNQNQNNNNQNSTSSPGSSSQVGSSSQPQPSSSRNDHSSSIASSFQWTTSSAGGSSTQDSMSWTSQISSQPQWTSSQSFSRERPTSSVESNTRSASPSSDSFSSAAPSSTRAQSSEVSESPSVTASATSAAQSSDASSASVVVVTLTQTGTDGSSLIKSTMTSTSPGSLATGHDDSSHGSGGGLSSHDKKIVIGVCVGVGGFLLLLGVAFVVWRVWFKKPRYSPSPVSDISGQTEFKSNSFDDNDVFRQNIDQYHAPRSNAATNF